MFDIPEIDVEKAKEGVPKEILDASGLLNDRVISFQKGIQDLFKDEMQDSLQAIAEAAAMTGQSTSHIMDTLLKVYCMASVEFIEHVAEFKATQDEE